MKDTLGLIPQVFYDLIGRVVPGTAILTLGTILLAGQPALRAAAPTIGDLSAAAIGAMFAGGLAATYVLGVVMGAIGSLFEDGLRQPAFSDISQTAPAGEVRESDIPYVYDFILIHNQTAGARLAKLRAESHMCRGLVVGFAALAVAYITTHWNSFAAADGLVVTALTVSALASFNFQRHLRTRAWRLQINCWSILRGTMAAQHAAPEADRLMVKASQSTASLPAQP